MIKAIHEHMRASILNEINEKTKPLNSLGQIEELSLQIALIQGSLKPKVTNPTLIVMAADHGIARSGVSPYPQSVTGAMVANFASGGAAVNVFTKLLGWKLELINCGTVGSEEIPSVIHLHAGRGTRNFLEEKAMSSAQRSLCMEAGRNRVDNHAAHGSNTIGFGEMGIGNTSAAALLIHCLSSLPLELVVGRGAGCDDEQLVRKHQILNEALLKHGRIVDPLLALETYGGFEIACMTGAMLRAAERQMIVMVDGLIATSAALIAMRIDPNVKPYLVFAHQSEVSGHRELLAELGVKALLNLSMRLGEGTGVALALPLVQAAAAMLSEMATFASASVAKKGEE